MSASPAQQMSFIDTKVVHELPGLDPRKLHTRLMFVKKESHWESLY